MTVAALTAEPSPVELAHTFAQEAAALDALVSDLDVLIYETEIAQRWARTYAGSKRDSSRRQRNGSADLPRRL